MSGEDYDEKRDRFFGKCTALDCNRLICGVFQRDSEGKEGRQGNEQLLSGDVLVSRRLFPVCRRYGNAQRQSIQRNHMAGAGRIQCGHQLCEYARQGKEEIIFDELRKDYHLEKENKEAWIDEENKILSFHEIENSVRIEKPEEQFWVWVMDIAKYGYRIM